MNENPKWESPQISGNVCPMEYHTTYTEIRFSTALRKKKKTTLQVFHSLMTLCSSHLSALMSQNALSPFQLSSVNTSSSPHAPCFYLFVLAIPYTWKTLIHLPASPESQLNMLQVSLYTSPPPDASKIP